MKRIGFIGLGLMGGGMSMNLLKAGFPLTVWNRTADKMKPLLETGLILLMLLIAFGVLGGMISLSLYLDPDAIMYSDPVLLKMAFGFIALAVICSSLLNRRLLIFKSLALVRDRKTMY